MRSTYKGRMSYHLIMMQHVGLTEDVERECKGKY